MYVEVGRIASKKTVTEKWMPQNCGHRNFSRYLSQKQGKSPIFLGKKASERSESAFLPRKIRRIGGDRLIRYSRIS